MEPTTAQIPDHITVNDLAQTLDIPVTTLIGELIKNGVMATMNDVIDFDTAQIIVAEIDPERTLERAIREDEAITHKQTRQERVMEQEAPRPPVVAVMGHVDHGKTTLLDSIRGADVVSGEAGGITQHIAAYQITHKDRAITFLDTPGHEAFASLRQHGAYLTDLVVLVVAADDGVKPQTKEAIKFARAANVPIMVALNKVDKPDANIPRVMQELNDAGLVPEVWGGDTVIVEVSAKQKTGIEKLIDMAFLVTDVEELVADSAGLAQGIVIESHMEQGRGAVVTVLVMHGQLTRGAHFNAGGVYGKVRTLEDYTGATIKSAGPSTPAIITGIKSMPSFGVQFSVAANEKEARAAAEVFEDANDDSAVAGSSSELLAQIHKDRMSKEIPVYVKADVRGSVTSVIDSLQSLANEEVSIRIVGSGVGAISESDVTMASASHAIIYGFNISVPANVKRLAAREGVEIRIYTIIYELIDDAIKELELLLSPDVVETEVGRLVVRGIFNTTKNEVICGGEVTKGKVKPGVMVRVDSEDAEPVEVSVISVHRGPDEVKEVVEGDMCGVKLKTDRKLILQEGDKLNFFTTETVKRTL